MSSIALQVNGKSVAAEVEPRTHLADFLREQQNLTGTHIGCEHGVCGACTLIVDGVPTRSCITYAVACDGASVTTIEGLDDDEIARELRAAFTREHALQCGYCTPGMMVSARDLVLRLEKADEHAVRIGMSGNLCRCTGYVGIVNATMSVIAERRGRGIAPVADARAVGPAGSGHAAAVASSSSAQRVAAVSDATGTGGKAADRLKGEWTPNARFAQSFTVDAPREKVWSFFEDISAVAGCLPGVTLSGAPSDDDIRGQLRVKIGPISTEFRGEAMRVADAAKFEGRIEGRGEDAKSKSSTRGRIVYRLIPENDGRSTRVDLDVGYTLSGMLAQFSRSGLIQSVGDRLVGAFAENLRARLSGREPAAAVSELKMGAVVLPAILDWLRGLFSRRR